MDHKSKIYEAIQYPFEKRKDDLGSKVSCNVRKAEERLRALNLSKEELEVLKEEYEWTYEGTKLGFVQQIAIFSAILAAVISIGNELFLKFEIGEDIFLRVMGILFFLILVVLLIAGFSAIIKKVCSGNDSARDYLMAIAILLWEKQVYEAALVHGENGTEA